MDLIGEQIFGPYAVTRVLEEGGAGLLLEAVHAAAAEDKIAVQLLGPEASRDATVVARACMEATVVSALDHPHIANLLGFGELDDGRPYVAWELLQGEELGQRLERTTRMPPLEVRRMLQQAGQALQAVHDEGMIHGALKPRYIFLAQDPRADDAQVVKLLDFGIGRVNDPQIPGPGSFLSPEQEKGGQDSKPDRAWDIFSLGSIAYLALAGEVAGRQPRPVSELVPKLPCELDGVLLRAMAPSKEDRYPQVSEFVEAFARAVASLEPVEQVSFTDHSTVLVDDEQLERRPKTGPVRPVLRPPHPTGPMPVVPLPGRPTYDTGPVQRPAHPTGPVPAVPLPGRPTFETGPVQRPAHPTGPMPAVLPRQTAIAPPLAPQDPDPPPAEEEVVVQDRPRSSSVFISAPGEPETEEEPTDFISMEQLLEGDEDAEENEENEEEEATIRAIDLDVLKELWTADNAAVDRATTMEAATTAETGAAGFSETVTEENPAGFEQAATSLLEAGDTAELPEAADPASVRPTRTSEFEEAATTEFSDPDLLNEDDED